MSEPASQGLCPLCGESNALTVAYCHRCNYRLPWADVVEGVHDTATKSIADEAPWLDHELKQWGLLPARTCVCRYCNKPIAADAKQCPHCQEWLVAERSGPYVDPWQPGYRDKDIQRVDMLKPGTGCFSILALMLAIIYAGIIRS